MRVSRVSMRQTRICMAQLVKSLTLRPILMLRAGAMYMTDWVVPINTMMMIRFMVSPAVIRLLFFLKTCNREMEARDRHHPPTVSLFGSRPVLMGLQVMKVMSLM